MQEGEEAQGKVQKEKIALFLLQQQRLLIQLIQEEQLIQHPQSSSTDLNYAPNTPGHSSLSPPCRYDTLLPPYDTLLGLLTASLAYWHPSFLAVPSDCTDP